MSAIAGTSGGPPMKKPGHLTVPGPLPLAAVCVVTA